MKKFQNMEHSNSRTFQGLSRALNFFPKFKDIQELLKDPMNPAVMKSINSVTKENESTS